MVKILRLLIKMIQMDNESLLAILLDLALGGKDYQTLCPELLFLSEPH
jgi:hypothetical protein